MYSIVSLRVYNHILDMYKFISNHTNICYWREKRDGKTFSNEVTPVCTEWYYAIAAAACNVIVGALVQCEGEFQKTFDDIIYKYRYSLRQGWTAVVIRVNLNSACFIVFFFRVRPSRVLDPLIVYYIWTPKA